ncbi:hypothetical protein [Exiguobacterium acetylicum]|mgnify:CR=1 FL=1|uniref:hypothetical protein n=1 Tax=Exiguobacterium acetylicum TaxID=41170 RepID=UPI0034D4C641
MRSLSIKQSGTALFHLAVTENDTLQNNSHLSDEELLNLQIDDVVSDKKVINEINALDTDMTKKEALEIEQSVLKLEEEEIHNEQNNVEALIAPVVVRAAISATVALLRKAGVNIFFKSKLSFRRTND